MLGEPTILARQPRWLAIGKPSGWLVHPAGTDAPDIQSWLATTLGGRWSPVHRLDGGTSGVVLYARPPDIADLAEPFAAGTVDKHYQALVFGTTRRRGTIERPLQDGRRGRPLPARTTYTSVEAFGRWTLLDVHPQTGRKHQIRRHLQGIGHAIVGDDRFRPRGRPTVPAFPGRLWLHARRLQVPGLPLLEMPLPRRLQEHLDVLRARRDAARG